MLQTSLTEGGNQNTNVNTNKSQGTTLQIGIQIKTPSLNTITHVGRRICTDD